ncbi:MAG TPA: hypothetical protein VHG28_10265 [Longimicrobiaceae bacterium]|nr:hypothetical protein [Longimicrobiaceae bacterium]
MRQVTDEKGRVWEAVAVEAPAAHMRLGAVLGFRPADEPGAESITSRIGFNSTEAAEFAIRTMSENELRRRLTISREMAGRV